MQSVNPARIDFSISENSDGRRNQLSDNLALIAKEVQRSI